MNCELIIPCIVSIANAIYLSSMGKYGCGKLCAWQKNHICYSGDMKEKRKGIFMPERVHTLVKNAAKANNRTLIGEIEHRFKL